MPAGRSSFLAILAPTFCHNALQTLGILGTSDLIELPPKPTFASMIYLVKIRGLRVPPHPTASNLTRLIAMCIGELITLCNFLVKRTLQLSLEHSGDQRSLRRSVRAGLSAFRRSSVAQHEAANRSSGLTSVAERDGQSVRASPRVSSLLTPPCSSESAEHHSLRSASPRWLQTAG